MDFWNRLFGKKTALPVQRLSNIITAPEERAKPTPSSAAEGPKVYVEQGPPTATVVRIFEPIDAAHVFVEEGVDDRFVFEELQRLHPEYLAQTPLPRVQVYPLSDCPDAIEPFVVSHLRQNQIVNLTTAKHKVERVKADGKMFYIVYLMRLEGERTTIVAKPSSDTEFSGSEPQTLIDQLIFEFARNKPSGYDVRRLQAIGREIKKRGGWKLQNQVLADVRRETSVADARVLEFHWEDLAEQL
jgi:hypothetical protein